MKSLKKTFHQPGIFCYITILILLFTGVCHSQWIQQNSGTNNDLNGVSFRDSLHGWAVGNNGIILRTTNGGNNWSPQVSAVRSSLRSVSFCDTMNGWAVGDEGAVIATSNGGEKWQFINQDTSINSYNLKVQCVSPTTAVIFNTRWEFDIFVDYRVWITSDAGTNWTEIAPQPYYYTRWFDIHFVSDSSGFISGISGNLYEKLIVVRTNDGGLTTDTSYINWKVQGGLKRIYFKNSMEGWLLGDSIYHSIDSGVNWKGIITNDFNTSKDLIMFGDTGYVVHFLGDIFQTTDGGYTWNEQSSGENPINDIDFVNSKVGWAVGTNGTILNTGGITGINDNDINSSPMHFMLYQNYPNPFNPTTKIKYTVPNVGNSFMKFIKIKVYDILGNEIATLVNEEKPVGNYEVEFNARSYGGSNLASGVYFYRMQAGNFFKTRKFILIK